MFSAGDSGQDWCLWLRKTRRSLADQAIGANLASPEQNFDMQELWRLALWGLAGTGAITLVAYATSTETGRDRIRLAFTQIQPANKPAEPSQLRAFDELEGRRLAETVRGLKADREPLLARIAALEQDIVNTAESVTRMATAARLPQQSQESAATRPAVVQPASSQGTVAAATLVVAAPPAVPVPVTVPVATAPSVASSTARFNGAQLAAAAQLTPPQPTLTQPAAIPFTIARPLATSTSPFPPPPAPPLPSLPSPPAIAQTKPAAAAMPGLPPRDRLSAISAPKEEIAITASTNVPAAMPRFTTEETQTPAVEGSADGKPEYGLDLGAASTVEAVRTLWLATQRRHPAQLEGLHPILRLRERAKPAGVELRLVAGPLSSATAAAKICIAMSAAGVMCQPTLFDGQRLALR